MTEVEKMSVIVKDGVKYIEVEDIRLYPPTDANSLGKICVMDPTNDPENTTVAADPIYLVKAYDEYRNEFGFAPDSPRTIVYDEENNTLSYDGWDLEILPVSLVDDNMNLQETTSEADIPAVIGEIQLHISEVPPVPPVQAATPLHVVNIEQEQTGESMVDLSGIAEMARSQRTSKYQQKKERGRREDDGLQPQERQVREQRQQRQQHPDHQQRRPREIPEFIAHQPVPDTKIAMLLQNLVTKEHRVPRDGEDYINTNATFSRSGVAARLDVTYRSNFPYFEYGIFASVMALQIYFTSTTPQHHLRDVSGQRARDVLRQIPRRQMKGMTQVIADATWWRVQVDQELMDFMVQNELPYNDIYYRRDAHDSQLKIPTEGSTAYWYMPILEEIARVLKIRAAAAPGSPEAETKPNFDFLARREYHDPQFEMSDEDYQTERRRRHHERYANGGFNDNRERNNQKRYQKH